MQALLQQILVNQEKDSSRMSNLASRLGQLEKEQNKISINDGVDKESQGQDGDVISDDESRDGSLESRPPTGMKYLLEQLKLIPEFNGDNISVETFIFELRIALREINADERNRFIRLVKAQKITGKAQRSLDGADIQNVEDFQQVLRLYFGETKTLDTARIERSMCMQGNENVLDYNRRFTNAQLNIRRAISNDSSIDSTHRKYALSDEEKHGLSQYIRGLKESHRIIVKAQRPKTIREAQNLALESEREDQMIKYYSSQRPSSSFTRTNIRPNISSNTTSRQTTLSPSTLSQPSLNTQERIRSENYQGKRIECYTCGKTGHISASCPDKRNFPSRRNPSEPPVQFISQDDDETLEQNLSCEEIMESTCDF